MDSADTSQPPPPDGVDEGGVIASPATDWAPVVEKIRAGDPAGMEALYSVFSTGIRYFLCRQLGPNELEDRVHDTFLIVAQAIRRGDLREPERLMGYIRTVVRRQIAAHIDTVVQNRRSQVDLDPALSMADHGADPEYIAIARQQQQVALRVLRGLPKRDREVLMRFYLNEQSANEICKVMNLTETQFRLIKSRAKSRFGELGKRLLARRARQPFS